MRNKTFSLVILILLAFLVSENVFAQISEAEAKKSVNTFFSFCKKNDFKNVAKYLAYTGSDNSRLYKDFFNPNNPDELKEIKRITKKVNATLLISDSFHFGKFRNRIINKKKFKSLEVIFVSGKQQVKKQILLLNIKGVPALFDNY